MIGDTPYALTAMLKAAPPPTKRQRPNLTVAPPPGPRSRILGENGTVELPYDEEEMLRLDSDSSASPLHSPLPPLSYDEETTELNREMAALEQLRRNVQKNLRLRPIKSNTNLKQSQANLKKRIPFSPQQEEGSQTPEPISSPTSSTSSSGYYTPLDLSRPSISLSASSPRLSSDSDSSSSGSCASPYSSRSSTPSPPPSWRADMRTPSAGPRSAYFTPADIRPPVPHGLPSKPASPRSSSTGPQPVGATELYHRLTAPSRPLLIDTRPLPAHQAFHIAHSIPVAIPSLILKRCRKPGGGFPSLDSLRQYITTDDGRQHWDDLVPHPESAWDGDVIVYDDEMDVKDKESMVVAAWALLAVIQPLLVSGHADYLLGGIGSAGHNPDLETLIVSDDSTSGGGASNGVFQLDTTLPKSSLQLEIGSASSSSSSSASIKSAGLVPLSPLPVMASVMPKYAEPASSIMDATPSPPPSQAGFRRPPPPPNRRPSVPNLRRLNTKSNERLPRLQVRTMPTKAATLSVPPLAINGGPPSPSHLNLTYSNHNSSPSSMIMSPTSPADIYSAYFTPPHTPTANNRFPSPPRTARPDDPPTTEGQFTFTVSTILPGFLYLGPEPSSPDNLGELKTLGVRRILNIAAECDDELGLNEMFERYVKIPMRDTVEEDNIARGMRQVCDILDDARLHSAPTYVHCKAGKSRSVTAVIAYLIHANHWTLSRAYQFVLDRRKGISPNIGFVSELMTFEEEELGGKSNGVQPSTAGADAGAGGGGDYGGMGAGRRGGHIRESLPPEGLSAGGIDRVVNAGDSAQEMEIRDASGRYRHARRAPVNEQTLQPVRRVSKAGLESSSYFSGVQADSD
ncbi:hypothetical protein CYLTODRAFT_445177 [Cylindrobasidium torrendii FP15055 ss-10]|uniref:protein-tyrosine-phosphatase n=1 Tax=Cylindrobasidium torrendii FP15055 ss-10 TaxID=1314674 RepID=A0A0D7B893_9AGAR|nr:hypothetical protein CYLTODRAFT_445177 [Cylindrobasidium torrendii FP15055 ss-10]